MTTVAQMIQKPVQQVSQTTPSQQTVNPLMGTRQNDGYQSFGGSLVRNTLIGAGMGAVAGTVIPGVGTLIGAGAGAAVGAGSALIRQPRVANAVGDGLKGAIAGATGGALIGTVTPFGPLGGAAVGAAGGFLTGTASGLLKTVSGGKYSIESETTVWGRMKKGFLLGATSGGLLGAGAGFMFGGIGAVPGAIWGAVMGGVGGAAYGAMSGGVDAATGAKGARFFGGGTPKLPGLPDTGFHLPGLPSVGGNTTQSPVQQSPVQQTPSQKGKAA